MKQHHWFVRCGMALALVVAVAVPAGLAAPASAETSHVTLSNTLDSRHAVKHSLVGPNLTPSSSTDFGRIGGAKGLTVQGSYFPGARVYNVTLNGAARVIDPDHGTVSAWYYQTAIPVGYDYGVYRIFGGDFGLPHEFVNFGADVLNGAPRLRFSVGGGASVVEVTSLADGLPGIDAAPLTGRWIHLTAAWDRSGIAGSVDGVRLYVDGVLAASSAQTNWDATIGRREDIGGGNDTDLAQKFYMRDLEVLDIASVPSPEAATITSVLPSVRGQNSGDRVVKIRGTGFEPGAVVSFSDDAITTTAPVVVSPTLLTVVVAVGATATVGVHDVTVTNPDETTATCLACFTVDAAPTITSVVGGSVAPGSTGVALAVIGANFKVGVTASTSVAGVTIESIARVDKGLLIVTIDVAADAPAATGPLSVHNPDGGTTEKDAAISVT